MKKSRLAAGLAVFSFLTSGFNSQIFASDSKFTGWKKAETEHFEFVFEEKARNTTEEYAKIADEAWNKISKVYSKPQDKIRIYVTDRTNTVNAFTYFMPLEINMFTTPCYIQEFGYRNEWHELFFTHELVHGANMSFETFSKTTGKLFGPIVPAFATTITHTPWEIEGLTTVLETELTEGGRGRSPVWELYYKAPALEDHFVPYEEIGLEKTPPRGQSYVIGYLMMRSIADRFGLKALADIERTKGLWGFYETAVYKVTGEKAEDIYQDVRKSLVKKYAEERKIPEGKIISPRNNKYNFYKPAVILDDGSIISLRTTNGRYAAVVKYNPSALPENETKEREKILFENNFPDNSSVTADAKGNIYAVLPYERQDRNPGYEVENAIYKWTEEKGLVRLTKGTSYFMPSVSRDGSCLVALKQNGLFFSLVKIDTENGNETELLSIPECNIFEPAVNEDGTKIAFIKADGKRGALCTTGSVPSDSYEIIANGEGDIIDVFYPSWNSNGKLLYSANTRGRLEIYEDGIPVVSDPVGALWAYQNEKGIYYWSYSSTGYVLKMKPNSEWENVPDFTGPSMPGQIIKFGNLQDDYPDYNPYPLVKSEKEQNEIKPRDPEIIKTLDDLTKTTALQNEKRFLNVPVPLYYGPEFNIVEWKGKNCFGFGYGSILQTSHLQNNISKSIVGFNYFPNFNNIDFYLTSEKSYGPIIIDLGIKRSLQGKEKNGESIFTESNLLIAGGTYNFLTRRQFKNFSNIQGYLFEEFFADRSGNEIIPINSRTPFDFYSYTKAGISSTIERMINKNCSFILSNDTNVRNYYMINKKESFPGVQDNFEAGYESNGVTTSFGVLSRYMPYKKENPIAISDFKYAGKSVDLSEPLRIRLSLSISTPFLTPEMSLFTGAEKLFSMNPVKDKTFIFDDSIALNAGYKVDIFGIKVQYAVNALLNKNGFDKESVKFTVSATLGLLPL